MTSLKYGSISSRSCNMLHWQRQGNATTRWRAETTNSTVNIHHRSQAVIDVEATQDPCIKLGWHSLVCAFLRHPGLVYGKGALIKQAKIKQSKLKQTRGPSIRQGNPFHPWRGASQTNPAHCACAACQRSAVLRSGRARRAQGKAHVGG